MLGFHTLHTGQSYILVMLATIMKEQRWRDYERFFFIPGEICFSLNYVVDLGLGLGCDWGLRCSLG